MPRKQPLNATDLSDASQPFDLSNLENDFLQSVIDLVRSDKPLSAQWRHLIANELENYYFHSPHRRRAAAVHRRQIKADAYRHIIDCLARVEGSTKTQAKEKLAAILSVSPEALDQRLKPSRVRGDKKS